MYSLLDPECQPPQQVQSCTANHQFNTAGGDGGDGGGRREAENVYLFLPDVTLVRSIENKDFYSR